MPSEEDIGSAAEGLPLGPRQELLQAEAGPRREQPLLHFYDDERAALLGDQIELGADRPEVPREDPPTLLLKRAADQALGGAVP